MKSFTIWPRFLPNYFYYPHKCQQWPSFAKEMSLFIIRALWHCPSPSWPVPLSSFFTFKILHIPFSCSSVGSPYWGLLLPPNDAGSSMQNSWPPTLSRISFPKRLNDRFTGIITTLSTLVLSTYTASPNASSAFHLDFPPSSQIQHIQIRIFHILDQIPGNLGSMPASPLY